MPRVAIVGRPNAGKSSLVNRLLGEARQLVDDRPGTTVDSVDALYEGDGQPLVLIDTAGMRRQRSVERGVEGLAVLSAMRAVERADTVVVMIDAERGAAEQDTKIAGLALEYGRAVVIALNKMDLLDEDGRKRAGAEARDVLSFLPWAPLVRISARTGRGVGKLLTTVREVTANHKRRTSTGEVNRFFEEVLARHPPPTNAGRPVRLYYITQARAAPPTFVVSSNQPTRVHFSYRRYVENQLRERFGLHGTPIRVHYHGRKGRS
jgi:GTP-binding protein